LGGGERGRRGREFEWARECDREKEEKGQEGGERRKGKEGRENRGKKMCKFLAYRLLVARRQCQRALLDVRRVQVRPHIFQRLAKGLPRLAAGRRGRRARPDS
jgi:hypothetical protein